MSEEFGSTTPPTAVPPVAPSVAPVRRGPGWFAVVVVAAVTAAIVGSVAGLGGYVLGRNVDGQTAPTTQPAPELPQVTTASTTRMPTSIAGIVTSVLPSVVSILAEGQTEGGSGSGFVLRKDGYILTNNHVVDLVAKGGTLTVVLADGTKLPAKVLGVNTSYDLAVVKVNQDDLPAVVLGDSDRLRVGDQVIAIGAPLGLEGTVTSGIISALDRPVTTGDTQEQTSYINAIQTDAAINPGNSGGPLLDGDGHVIGINSAIASLANNGEAGSIGLGFSIPVNSAKRIAEELIASGKSHTPALGVSLDTAYDGPGARIREVNAGGAAEQAGLEVGDVITTLAGRVIDSSTELVVAIRAHAPGETVVVDYTRDGKDAETTVVLGSLPDAG